MLKTNSVPSEPNKAVVYLLERILYELNENEAFNLSEDGYSELVHLVELLRVAAQHSDFDISDKIEKIAKSGQEWRAWNNSTNELYRIFQLKAVEENFKPYNKHEKFCLRKPAREEILTAIQAIRSKIRSADFLTDEHKARLLAKLGEVEQEVYKKEGTLRTVLSEVEMVGATFKRLGKDIKPLTDRITEIAGNARSDEDPGKLLPHEERRQLPAPSKAGEAGTDF
jgi:hypothetical protein